jgi:ribosomal protein L24E
MKKGEKREGDYQVKLTKNVNCFFCGKDINKGEKTVRVYSDYPSYYHIEDCEGKIEALSSVK